MEPLPAHYQKLFAGFIRLGCGMAFLGLIAGILFRESTRKLSYTNLPPGLHWEATYHLALVHGHVFLIGVLIPMAVLAMLYFSLLLGGRAVSSKALRWGGWLYHFGAGIAVLLLLYKGYHYVLSVRAGQLDFPAIDYGFFGGIHWLRGLVYGASHAAMGIGLGILVMSILQTLPKPKMGSG